MADDPAQTPETDDEELLLTDEVVDDLPDDTEGDDEEIPTFGDEPTEVKETDNATIRHLREELKKARKEAAEKRSPPTADEPVEVGEKPTLWDDDIAGDEDLYDQKMEAYRERKAKADRRRAALTDAEEAERQDWQAELDRVAEEKVALGRSDVEDAFDLVRTSLNLMQQAVIVKATEPGKTAQFTYALAKSPTLLAEIAGITDPFKLAAKIAKLEGKLTMVKRRRAPDPDTPERPSAPTGKRVSSDAKRLAELEKQADEGKLLNRTELIQLRKKLKDAN